MKKILFKGCGTAIVTPFASTGGIDYAVFSQLIEDQIAGLVDSIIVCGTTGESSTMSEQERKEAIAFVVKQVDGRVPVIAGTGSNNTSATIAMTKYAEEVGADGALLVTPYYNKTTQEGLIAHYKAIAASTTLPLILYNVPSRTGVNIAPETCLALSSVENIVAIKEASGNLSQVAKIASLCGENLSIYSGNDDQVLPILSLGGIGVISVLSNIHPRFVHDMVTHYLEGEWEDAKTAQLKAIPLIEALFCEVNPIPIKAALKEKGYAVGNPRLPLVPMSANGLFHLKKTMQNFE